jgi:hypothetical protein
MMSQQFRNAVGWMPLVVGVMLLIGSIGELELAAHCTPEAQRLTLQELLDGKAGENRHVEITDFRPCDRCVVGVRKGGSHYIEYLGVQPAHSEGGAESPSPPRVLIAQPQCTPEPGSIADWSQRQTISGILEKPYRRDEQQLRGTYPGIDLPSCRILLEGRKPQPARESWTLFAMGVGGIALGGWMLHPGLLSLVWNRWRGVKSVQPGARTTPGPPASRVPATAPQASRGGESRPMPKAPLLDRILAVAYVLSFAVQPLGFLLLAGIGSFLWAKRGLDGTVLGFGLGGIGWVASWSAFRWWVRRLGQRRWPNEESPDEAPRTGSNPR